jgi:hypothetical protein
MNLRFDTTQQVLDWLSEDGRAKNPHIIEQARTVKKVLKYKNRPTEAAGLIFQSGKEASDYGKLMLGIRSGELIFIIRQVVFVLQEKPKIEYIADFVVGYPNGSWEALDSKGMLTDPFKLKQKLFTKKFGKPIKIL